MGVGEILLFNVEATTGKVLAILTMPPQHESGRNFCCHNSRSLSRIFAADVLELWTIRIFFACVDNETPNRTTRMNHRESIFNDGGMTNDIVNEPLLQPIVIAQRTTTIGWIYWGREREDVMWLVSDFNCRIAISLSIKKHLYEVPSEIVSRGRCSREMRWWRRSMTEGFCHHSSSTWLMIQFTMTSEWKQLEWRLACALINCTFVVSNNN